MSMPPAQDARFARATVLVVDDVPANLEVIGGLLRAEYVIKVANSGERALRAARSQPVPDVILLDVMMPVMDGYAVLAALRESPETRDIPVIFVTALEADEDEKRGLELGAVDYVTKPVKPAILQARVRTQVELKQHRDRLRDANRLVRDVGLHALAALAEARDGETGFHLQRTQHYVAALGRQLLREGHYVDQLSGGRLSHMVRAAPLHDIGKVGIPDHILCKPAKLTSDEFETMKTHARIGAEAIGTAIERVLSDPAHDDTRGRDEALALFRVAQEIAGNHHERWDGSGYPQGLAGEDIPLSARLMALADVYDALNCRRVYKNPVPAAQIVQLVRDARGGHFDPKVVDAFLAVQDEFRDIGLRFADAPGAGA